MLKDVIVIFTAERIAMMTADLVTGHLGWNTSLLDEHVVLEVKGKDFEKPSKRIPSVDTSAMVKPSKSGLNELDNMVYMMETQETLPSGTRSVDVGKTTRGSGSHGGYMKKEKPGFDATSSEIDRIATKYGASPSKVLAKRTYKRKY